MWMSMWSFTCALDEQMREITIENWMKKKSKKQKYKEMRMSNHFC